MPWTAARPTDGHGSRLVLHQDGVEAVEFVCATCEAGDARRHADERSWWRLQRL
jgi:hypothetical protein